MKRNYINPSLSVWLIETQNKLMATSTPETDILPVYDDDPQTPGNALTRLHDVRWDEEE